MPVRLQVVPYALHNNIEQLFRAADNERLDQRRWLARYRQCTAGHVSSDPPPTAAAPSTRADDRLPTAASVRSSWRPDVAAADATEGCPGRLPSASTASPTADGIPTNACATGIRASASSAYECRVPARRLSAASWNAATARHATAANGFRRIPAASRIPVSAEYAATTGYAGAATRYLEMLVACTIDWGVSRTIPTADDQRFPASAGDARWHAARDAASAATTATRSEHDA